MTKKEKIRSYIKELSTLNKGETAISQLPDLAQEKPSSLLRRRSALRLIAEIGVAPHQWPLLRPLLNESDAEILIGTFKIAAAAAEPADVESAFRLLMEVIENTNWQIKSQIEDALVGRFEARRSVLENAIALRRRQMSKGNGNFDPVWAILLNVKHRSLLCMS